MLKDTYQLTNYHGTLNLPVHKDSDSILHRTTFKKIVSEAQSYLCLKNIQKSTLSNLNTGPSPLIATIINLQFDAIDVKFYLLCDKVPYRLVCC